MGRQIGLLKEVFDYYNLLVGGQNSLIGMMEAYNFLLRDSLMLS